MSVKIMAAVFDRYPAGGGERLLALALADCANDDGTRIWPSVALLAKMSAQSERSVQRQLLSMLASGWLILVHKSSGRRGDTTEYRISERWLEGGALVPPETVPERGIVKPATGDNLSPVPRVTLTPSRVTLTPSRVTLTPSRVTPEVLTGDTAVSPNPSIPINDPSIKGEARARAAAAPPRPDDVEAQVWADWTALRKAKRAPVTATVLAHARSEAVKAGMPLNRFLAVWCARGSQGLQADWLRPHERAAPRSASPPQRESFAQADRRAAAERMAKFAPGIADRSALAPQKTVFEGAFDVVATSRH